MKARQIIVDLIVVVALIALGVFCYFQGKAYDLLISNRASTVEGQEYDAMEAVQVRVLPMGKVIKLYADDSLVYEGQVVGPKVHSLEIAPLDLDDKPISAETKIITFRAKEVPIISRRGSKSRTLFVPSTYATGSVKVDMPKKK